MNLEIRHIQDFRNYKVSIQKAENVLSFHPQHNVKSIIANLIEHRAQFRDWENPVYYHLRAFKKLETFRKVEPVTDGHGF